MSEFFSDINKNKISDFHNLCLNDVNWPKNNPCSVEDSDAWYWIIENHKYNCNLWEEEDLARRIDVSDADIAKNKRNIDFFNQNRNDAIEKIDDLILSRLVDINIEENAWVNSETIGSIIDRLSITSLKIFHMDIQAKRSDISINDRKDAQLKQDRLIQQKMTCQLL